MFEVKVDDSAVTVAGEHGAHALVLEGQFLFASNDNGLQDIADGSCVYIESKENKLCRNVSFSFENLAAYICTWRDSHSGSYNLNECKRRLLIVPIASGKFIQDEISNIDITCTRVVTRSLKITDITAAVSYLDTIYVLQIAEHHLEHLSRAYFHMLSDYFNSAMPQLKDAPDVFKYKQGFSLKPSELVEREQKAVEYFVKESEKYRELGRRLDFKKEVNKPNDHLARLPSKYKAAKITINIEKFFFAIDKGVNLILINQLRGIFSPLFMVNIRHPEMNFETSMDEEKTFALKLKPSINYYNQNASDWESLLEPFFVHVIRHRKKTNELTKITTRNSLNINLNETFISMLQDCWDFWNSKGFEEHEANERFVMVRGNSGGAEEARLKLDYETASGYSIDNQLGEPIRITVLDLTARQTLDIGAREKVNICTEPSEEVKAFASQVKREFNVRVEFVSGTPPIREVNLSEVNEFVHGRAGSRVICSNRVVGMRKVLTLATANQIENKLELPLVVIFRVAGKEMVEYNLNGGASMSVPLMLVDMPISISLRGFEGTAKSQFTFAELEDKFRSSKVLVQITIGNSSYAVLACGRTASGGLKVVVWPSFCVYNCLPVDAKVKFISQNSDFEVKSMENVFVYTQSMVTESALEISIPKFEKAILKYSRDNQSYVVDLRDRNGREVRINAEVLSDNKAKFMFVLYADYAIKKLTDDHLIFFYINVRLKCTL